MWYDNERVPEEEGVSKLLVGKTFAYFPKCPDDEGRHVQGEGDIPHGGNPNQVDNMETMDHMNSAGNEGITDNTIEDVEDTHRGDDPVNESNGDSMHNIDAVDSVFFKQKEYVLIQQRLGRTIIPLNPELLAQSTMEQEIIDGYLSEIHKNVGKHLNEWTPKSHYMSLIFLYMRNIFYLKDEYSKENIENEEAYFLLNNDRELFLRKVQDCVQKSNEQLYQQLDNYMFNFSDEMASREISNMMEQVKDDSLCNRKAEAFIHWLVNDYAGGTSENPPSEDVISENPRSEEILSEDPPSDGEEEGGEPPNEVTPHCDNAKREHENDDATSVDATPVEHLRRDRKKR